MKGYKIYLLSWVLLLSFISCKKENTFSPIKEGIYKGTFRFSNPENKVLYAIDTKLILLNGTFINPKRPKRFPGGGSGSYKVLGKQSILFQDHNAWTSDFNHNLIMNGLYKYSFNGKDLIIWKELFGDTYELKLELVKKL